MKRLALLAQSVLAVIALGTQVTAAEAASPLGPKPHCTMGKIAKVENGQWVCRDLTITNAQPSDPTASNLPQKPHCRLGLVAKFENGAWSCKELTLTQDAGRDPTRNQAQKPNCTQGKLPKFENGQWTCKTPDFTSKPQTPEGLLLPAIQK